MSPSEELSILILNGTHDPLWGEVFQHILAGDLLPEDQQYICDQAGHDFGMLPSWLQAAANGNPVMPREVCELVLELFLERAMGDMENAHPRRLYLLVPDRNAVSLN